MDSFELNKIAGAVLFCMLVIVGLHNLGNILVAPKKLAENAYKVEVPETEGAATATAAAEPAKPIAELLAAADAKRGEVQFRKCATCHTPDKGGANRVGPNLWDIVGNKMAHIDGFAYSNNLAGKGGTWGYEELSAFIANPRAFIPGTKMAFAGIRKPEERADLLAYLRTLSDSPKPLPGN
ncbi:MAG: cytochrome c family protein [Alphaproteobacteria bacterium]|nr:cytochrome c family protein [Alphaproteobacteria bacterium]